MKEMDEEQWDNRDWDLQAKMVEFSAKRNLTASWIEEWLGTFSEAGERFRDLRDLASILIEYQN